MDISWSDIGAHSPGGGFGDTHPASVCGLGRGKPGTVTEEFGVPGGAKGRGVWGPWSGHGQGSLGSLVGPWERVPVRICVLVMPPEAPWNKGWAELKE